MYDADDDFSAVVKHPTAQRQQTSSQKKNINNRKQGIAWLEYKSWEQIRQVVTCYFVLLLLLLLHLLFISSEIDRPEEYGESKKSFQIFSFVV